MYKIGDIVKLKKDVVGKFPYYHEEPMKVIGIEEGGIESSSMPFEKYVYILVESSNEHFQGAGNNLIEMGAVEYDKRYLRKLKYERLGL